MTTAKIKKLISKIEDLMSIIDDEIEDCENKKNIIDDRASNRRSGEMTEKEEEMYDDLDGLTSDLDEAKEYLQSAIDSIDDMEGYIGF